MRIWQLLSLLPGLFSGCGVNDHGAPITPLIVAARNGEIPAIIALLRHGADPNLRAGVNNWTPLLHAIHKGQRASAAALLAGGADVNAAGNGGTTPLILAAGYGDTAMVQLLLDHGADPRRAANNGATPLAAALGGIGDADNFTFGNCQAGTVAVLKRKDPGLSLPDNFWSRTAKLGAAWAKLRGCAY